MKVEYDLSKLKYRKNPYASKLKKPVTMRLSEDVVDYFKGMAEESGVPYKSLMDLRRIHCDFFYQSWENPAFSEYLA